jgi:hypothetical protein
MIEKIIFTGIAVAVLSFSASAITPSDNFKNGIIGTGFVSNGGSSTYEYKVLINYRVHGRHRVELKFVERDNYNEPPLSDDEKSETVMVNCTRHTYTTSLWLKDNDNNYGFKQYKNGDAISWEDGSEQAYANYGNGFMLPIYLKMVCDSL